MLQHKSGYYKINAMKYYLKQKHQIITLKYFDIVKEY